MDHSFVSDSPRVKRILFERFSAPLVVGYVRSHGKQNKTDTGGEGYDCHPYGMFVSSPKDYFGKDPRFDYNCAVRISKQYSVRLTHCDELYEAEFLVDAKSVKDVVFAISNLESVVNQKVDEVCLYNKTTGYVDYFDRRRFDEMFSTEKVLEKMQKAGEL